MTTAKQQTTASHTPGPWRYETSTRTIRSVPSNYWLASMNNWDGAVNNEVNARLIASAPELLKALQAIQARIVGDFDNPALLDYGPLGVKSLADIRNISKTAIAKATQA